MYSEYHIYNKTHNPKEDRSELPNCKINGCNGKVKYALEFRCEKCYISMVELQLTQNYILNKEKNSGWLENPLNPQRKNPLNQ